MMKKQFQTEVNKAIREFTQSIRKVGQSAVREVNWVEKGINGKLLREAKQRADWAERENAALKRTIEELKEKLKKRKNKQTDRDSVKAKKIVQLCDAFGLTYMTGSPMAMNFLIDDFRRLIRNGERK